MSYQIDMGLSSHKTKTDIPTGYRVSRTGHIYPDSVMDLLPPYWYHILQIPGKSTPVYSKRSSFTTLLALNAKIDFLYVCSELPSIIESERNHDRCIGAGGSVN